MSGYALRLQCQLDKHIKFNGIAHRPEPCHAIISSRQLAGVVQTQRTPLDQGCNDSLQQCCTNFFGQRAKNKIL